jgi:hypothetical protein
VAAPLGAKLPDLIFAIAAISFTRPAAATNGGASGVASPSTSAFLAPAASSPASKANNPDTAIRPTTGEQAVDRKIKNICRRC